MKFSRRKFLGSTALGALLVSVPKIAFAKSGQPVVKSKNSFDPWIEIDPLAIKHNVRQLYKLSGSSPIIAVVKNNGYGLGTVAVAKILEEMDEVVGFALVKPEACLSLRDVGVKKPILHMGIVSNRIGEEMVEKDIHLSTISEQSKNQFEMIAKRVAKKVKTHIYIDSGMSRMGIPYHKALPVIEQLNKSDFIQISGMFSGFTEDTEYDKEQLKRIKELASKAKASGVAIGKVHMASSTAVFNFSESKLDMVRPGLALYGGYPSDYEKEKEIAKLKVGFNLKARVARVEQIRTGDSVSYGRSYVAKKPTWIATLPIGHADGYIRMATKGAKVLVNGKVYPVIGFVSASHTIIELGEEASVTVGDVATLYGEGHDAINPNKISAITGVSIYDVFMHLSAKIPKTVIG